MDLGECGYCHMLGLVMTVRNSSAGLVVHSQCTVCGYICDSDYPQTENVPDDLPCEFSTPLEYP